MQPCLAATGTDSTLLLVLAGLLAVAGIALAVVAVRRRGAAGLLLLALPLLAGGSLLATPAPPAQAQVGVPCPTPTPTPTCTPEVAVPGDAVEAPLGWGESDSGTTYQALFEDADLALYTTTAATVFAIDDTPTVTAAAFVVSEDPPVGPVALTADDFSIDGTVLNVDTPVFEDIVDAAELGTFRVEITFTYDDGCGGTLSTVFTFAADFDFRPVP